jgi:hypothetical protein
MSQDDAIPDKLNGEENRKEVCRCGNTRFQVEHGKTETSEYVMIICPLCDLAQVMMKKGDNDDDAEDEQPEATPLHQQWEYLRESRTDYDTLNALGAQGWELVTFAPAGPLGTWIGTYKRPFRKIQDPAV